MIRLPRSRLQEAFSSRRRHATLTCKVKRYILVNAARQLTRTKASQRDVRYLHLGAVPFSLSIAQG
jgi:hypothetical protein